MPVSSFHEQTSPHLNITCREDRRKMTNGIFLHSTNRWQQYTNITSNISFNSVFEKLKNEQKIQ